MEHGVLAYLLGVGSALLVGFSKTGLPGVSIPAILLMTEAFGDDARLGVGALLPVLLVGDLFAVAWYRHHAQWDRLLRLFPYVAAGMVPGWLVLRAATDNGLRPVIGALVLAMVLLEFGRRALGWQHVPHRWWFTAATGLLAGLATIVAHAAFPVMSVYLISQGMAKRQFIGTAAWFFLVLNLTKVPIYVYEQMITPATLRYDLVVAPMALVGGLVGIYVLAHIPQRFFDSLALTLAAAAAVRLILV